MRISMILLPLVLFAGACRQPPPRHPEPEPPPPMTLEEAALAFEAGSVQGEARLAAAGPDAVPHVRPLLSSDDPEVRRRALRLLVDTGEDMGLTVRERVELLLDGIVREDGQPWSSLKSLAALDEMGDAALPALREAAEDPGPRGATARRLLLRRAR